MPTQKSSKKPLINHPYDEKVYKELNHLINSKQKTLWVFNMGFIAIVIFAVIPILFKWIRYKEDILTGILTPILATLVYFLAARVLANLFVPIADKFIEDHPIEYSVYLKKMEAAEKPTFKTVFLDGINLASIFLVVFLLFYIQNT